MHNSNLLRRRRLWPQKAGGRLRSRTLVELYYLVLRERREETAADGALAAFKQFETQAIVEDIPKG
jgi:hypothetical protein